MLPKQVTRRDVVGNGPESIPVVSLVFAILIILPSHVSLRQIHVVKEFQNINQKRVSKQSGRWTLHYIFTNCIPTNYARLNVPAPPERTVHLFLWKSHKHKYTGLSKYTLVTFTARCVYIICFIVYYSLNYLSKAELPFFEAEQSICNS
jgi:hypothetical protein